MSINELMQEIFITYPQESQYYNFNCFYLPSRYVTAPQERSKTIRVISGMFGKFVRMSAPEIGIIADGSTVEEAWTVFLKEAQKINETDWLAFDIGPTRPEEIADGLNIPENEDWSAPLQRDEE